MAYTTFPFFSDCRYVAMKSILYNYILRKKAIEKEFAKKSSGMILELGSGISPISESSNTIYTDLSFDALFMLKTRYHKNHCIVADICHLPFKNGLFSYVICSEVLEHLKDDRGAIKEVSRVLKKDGGLFILTFPHKHAYFAIDDRYVGHKRRYELEEILSIIEDAGMHVIHTKKILGPLEKLTMIVVTWIISTVEKIKKETKRSSPSSIFISVLRYINKAYAFLLSIENTLIPKRFASVLLVKAIKEEILSKKR